MPALRVTPITAGCVGKSGKVEEKPYTRPTSKNKTVGAPANSDSTLEFPTGMARARFVLPSGKSITAHQWKVFDMCLRIPKGEVTTYGHMAKVLESFPRAVGGALRDNPFAPYVPCHRIVSSDGSLGGYQGDFGGQTPKLQKKLSLLKSEGVEFDQKGVLVGGKAKIWTGR